MVVAFESPRRYTIGMIFIVFDEWLSIIKRATRDQFLSAHAPEKSLKTVPFGKLFSVQYGVVHTVIIPVENVICKYTIIHNTNDCKHRLKCWHVKHIKLMYSSDKKHLSAGYFLVIFNLHEIWGLDNICYPYDVRVRTAY